MNVQSDNTHLAPTPGAQRNEMSHETSNDTETGIGKTTGFLNDGENVVNPPTLFKPIQTGLLNLTTATQQTLKDFLMKPIVLEQGTLDGTVNTATNMYNKFIFRDMLANAMYSQKTNGFYGFKANVKLRLVVNANPFQQGRYILGYVPVCGANTNQTSVVSNLRKSRFSLVQCSQLPHVEIDVACDTQAELLVPFISCEPFYPLSQLAGAENYGEIANVFIRPYVGLTYGTGASTAPYTLWANFEDIELFAPTVPQSGWRQRYDKASKYAKKQLSNKPHTEQERDALKVGPVSSVAQTIKTIAGYVSVVPGLETAANIVGWGADIVGNIASAFGWSRPINLGPSHYMSKLWYPYFNNVDGVENTKPAGFTTTNSLESIDFTGSTADELSFDFLKGIPSYFSTLTWTAARVSGDDLALQLLGRNNFSVAFTDVATTTYNLPPFAYLSEPFVYWRGGFIIKLKFVKTKFHSGRLLVTYYPSDRRFPIVSSPSILNTNYLYREIVDIRETNEVTFEFPYVNSASYLPDGANIGCYVIKVLDPLVAPSTVSSSISIICEVSAAPDFEVAVPGDLPLAPFIPLLAQMDPCALGTVKFGDSAYDLENLSARSCIGEKIVSARQLLRLKGNVMARSAALSNLTGTAVSSGPYARECAYGLVGTTGKVDLFNYFGQCYGLERGSINICFMTKLATSMAVKVDYNNVPNYPNPATIYTATTNSIEYNNYTTTFTPKTQYDMLTEGNATVNVPYYNKYSCHPVSETIYAGAVLTPNWGTKESHYPGAVINAVGTTAANQFFVSRSIGEDYGIGCFISCPPVVIQADNTA